METVMTRLSKNQQVRRTLAEGGRLHIDRLLPFICVYRRPAERADPGTDRLAVTSAAYLLVDGNRRWVEGTAEMLQRIATLMTERFGAFLVLEIWSSPDEAHGSAQTPPRPAFNIYHQKICDMPDTLDAARKSLSKIRISRQRAAVECKVAAVCSPPGIPPLLGPHQMRKSGVRWMGLEVAPVHIDPVTGESFPLLLRSIRRQVGHVLDQIVFTFSAECTTHQPPHYHTLGRRAVVKAAWEIDRRLYEVGRSFDLLHLITPVNVEMEWRRFRGRRFQVPPRFLYRPHPVDPDKMKARLYSIPIDRIEDPTLMNLFLDKQHELDRQLTLLMDRNRAPFLYGSLQLYGKISDKTLQSARSILENMSGRPGRSRQMLDAEAIRSLAAKEIAAYRKQAPDFEGTAVVSDNMYAGLLVSQGCLLVGRGASVSAKRADALIQHEVGTHLLTWSNGRAQPFRLLASGLPGYDGLQEGLAVLAEYLAGGLDAARLRLLAIRVVAVSAMIEGATFIEVFRMLTGEYGFSQRSAYMVAMRVFRGGGCTKDAVYLDGLLDVLSYLGDGGTLAPLFAGKFALNHLPMIEELLLRKVLVDPITLPRYLDDPEAQGRLEKARAGLNVLQLVGTSSRRS